MGLDFTVRFDTEAEFPHWSYGGFNSFRTRLAKQIGIDLERMERFGGSRPWETVSDPIKPLLDHSDCDGTLPPKSCGTIAPRLRELVSTWTEHQDALWNRNQALLLADLMEECARRKKSLIFC